MNRVITGEMKVGDVIERYPASVDIFLSHGCPDMRKGVFRLMCRIMSVKAAARMHRLPLDNLLRDLNAAATPES